MVETLLEVRNLSKTFRYRTGWFHRQGGSGETAQFYPARTPDAGDYRRERPGKSTLAKMLAGMVEPTSGELLIDDHPLTFGDTLSAASVSA
jgi:cationic peptide transport system ATP-binding protein